MLDNRQLNFSGVKIALLHDNQVLTILRDDIPTIPYPNMWELPGVGREDNESPFECVQREVYEELGIWLPRSSIGWVKTYSGIVSPHQLSVFMVAHLSRDLVVQIVFGDEGQCYQFVAIAEFLEDSQTIPQLQERFKDYLEMQKGVL